MCQACIQSRANARATAAEAKLARAARILRNANLHEATRIVDALDALQQGTKDQ